MRSLHFLFALFFVGCSLANKCHDHELTHPKLAWTGSANIACNEVYEAAYEEFIATFKGDIVTEETSRRAYRKDRIVWNQKRRGSKPAMILLPRDTADVARIMTFCRQFGIRPRIKSGGHSYSGFCSVEGGWVIFMRHLDTIELDEEKERVRVGAGVRLEAVYEHLKNTRFSFVGGSCPSVGVSGFALGGGHSAISRMYGTASDNIHAMTVVLANASVVTASRTENSDLFWALTGSGHNNFGVVTDFLFKVHNTGGKYVIGKLSWWFLSKRKLATLLKTFSDFVQTAPNEIYVNLVFRFPGTEFMTFAYQGDSIEKAKEILAPFFKGIVRPMVHDAKIGGALEYSAYFAPGIETNPLPIRTYFQNAMFNRFGPKTIASMVNFPRRDMWTILHCTIHALGGRISEISGESSSYTHREAKMSVSCASNWFFKAGDSKHITAMKDMGQKWREADDDVAGYYVNYPDEYMSNWATSYYGDRVGRLLEIKKLYDPDHFFQYEQGLSTLLLNQTMTV